MKNRRDWQRLQSPRKNEKSGGASRRVGCAPLRAKFHPPNPLSPLSALDPILPPQAAQSAPTNRKTPRPQTQSGENARPSPDGAPPGQCPRIAAPPQTLPAKSTADSAFARCIGMPLMAPPPCRLAGLTPDPARFRRHLNAKKSAKNSYCIRAAFAFKCKKRRLWQILKASF